MPIVISWPSVSRPAVARAVPFVGCGGAVVDVLAGLGQRRKELVSLGGERVLGGAAGRVQPPHLSFTSGGGKLMQHRQYRRDADSGGGQQHWPGPVIQGEGPARGGDLQQFTRCQALAQPAARCACGSYFTLIRYMPASG